MRHQLFEKIEEISQIRIRDLKYIVQNSLEHIDQEDLDEWNKIADDRIQEIIDWKDKAKEFVQSHIDNRQSERES